MKNNLISLCSLMLVAAALASATPVQGKGVSDADREFIKKAAAGGMTEVRLSELALKRATDPKIKDFANQMITDHTKANNKLQTIATANGVSLPKKLQGEGAAAYRQLSGLSGASFDAAYVKIMIQDHDKTVSAFEAASSKVSNADLKSFISNTLPTLRQHQEHAHELGGHAKGAETGSPSLNVWARLS